ncbi:uncharacterized mitochondrial protein-like protein [Tanacetum coccineum]
MVPRAVLMKSGLVSIDTARQVNTAHTKTTVNGASLMSNLSKTSHSTVKRPTNKNTAFKNSNFNQRVNTVRGNNVNTARPKAVVNVVKGNHVNVVKASACWVWKPKIKVIDHGNPQIDLQDQGVIDSGCSRHMTGNMSYLIDYEEIDGGYVAFGENPKGGKITGKATKDETSGILKSFITGIENLVDHKVRVIGCDNETEFKNREMNQIYEIKGIKRQFSVARTPQQNGVSKKRNRTLIEAARTMLADFKLPTTFWAEKPIVAGTQSNGFAGTKANDNADPKSSQDDGFKPSSNNGKKVDKDPRKDCECNDQEKEDNVNSTNTVNAASSNEVNAVGTKTSIELLVGPDMPELEDYSIFEDDKDIGAEADMNNLDTTIQVSPIPTTRIHKDHPLDQVIGNLQSATQTRRMLKNLEEHGFVRFEDPDFPDRVYKVKKHYMDYIKLLEPGMKPCQHIYWTMSFKEGKLTRPYSPKGTKQKKNGIFISQDKYVGEILKKFGFTEVKTTSTPIETQKPLLKDENGEEVDVHMYRSMIGSLMYLTSSRPDIMFVVCARYHVNPKVSHLYAVKRIFRYLKGKLKLGLWYPKDYPFDLIAYTNSDYARANLDRKSTTGGCQFLGCRLISWQCKKHTVVANSTTEAEYVAASICPGQVLWIQNQLLDCGAKTTAWNEFSSTMTSAIICLATNQKLNFSKYIFECMVRNVENVSGKFLMYSRFVQVFLDKQLEANPTDPYHTHTIIQPSISQPQRKQRPRKPKRKDTETPQSSGPTDNVADETVNEEMDDSLERAATTAASFDAEQDMGNINKTQSKATPNEPSSPGTSSGAGPSAKKPWGIQLLRLGLRMYLNFPMIHYSQETSQAQEITSLKRRVKRLEKKNRSRTHGLKRLYKVGLSSRIESSEEEGLGEEDASKHGRINDIDANEDIYLVNVHTDEDMFGVNDLDGDELVSTASTIPVSAATTTSTTTVITDVDITLAQALAALKSEKPKADKVMIQEPEQGTIRTTAATTVTAASTRPKAKGLIIHEEEQSTTPIMKKKDQISFDEQEAIRLQAEFDKEERLAREKDEANIALTEEWNDIHAKIDADYQLAQRLQA